MRFGIALYFNFHFTILISLQDRIAKCYTKYPVFP
jgi:hypothetical protein